MWLIPYERFTISTRLSAEEVTRAIISTIYIPNGSSLKGYDLYETKYFTGWIQGKTFQLKRNVVYSAKEIPPDIYGEIIAINSGAEIQVKIYSKVVMILLSVAIIFLLIAGITMTVQSNRLSNLPFIMIIPAYLIILLPFKVQATRIKDILLTVSEGDVKRT